LSPDSGIGINLSFPEQGGTFVDVVKKNCRWTMDGNDLARANVDDKGWPKVESTTSEDRIGLHGANAPYFTIGSAHWLIGMRARRRR
jgi:hypothetical protein